MMARKPVSGPQPHDDGCVETRQALAVVMVDDVATGHADPSVLINADSLAPAVAAVEPSLPRPLVILAKGIPAAGDPANASPRPVPPASTRQRFAAPRQPRRSRCTRAGTKT
jgi:hypothetical protein